MEVQTCVFRFFFFLKGTIKSNRSDDIINECISNLSKTSEILKKDDEKKIQKIYFFKCE